MLRGIPACLSPDLVHALMTMGHGEELLLADVDYPAASASRRVIRADGVETTTLLEALLPFFPLDTFVEHPVLTMDCSAWGDEPPSYERFRAILRQHTAFSEFGYLNRDDFYERGRSTYVVVVTGEKDGNLILKKGPVAVSA
jgi:L-fucose mutarotase